LIKLSRERSILSSNNQPMKSKKPIPKKTIHPKKGMKLWTKIVLWCGALTIAGFAAAPLVMKWTKKDPRTVDTGMKKGLITRVWMELPRHDVRLHSPGPPPVYEEAWLDTMYFMEIKDPSKENYRTVEIYKPMYWKYRNSINEFIQLEADSAEVARKQAKWDADSAKYYPALKEAREKAAKKNQQQ
jgi:hypothetical protein